MFEPRKFIVAALVAAGGIVAVAAPSPAQAAPVPAADYQQVGLASGSAELGEPMSLAVLPNRSVLHTARNGTVRVTDAAGNTKVAGTIPVYTHDEEGMQGVAVDPNFAQQPLHLPLLLAAAEHARPATRRPPAPTADFDAVEGAPQPVAGSPSTPTTPSTSAASASCCRCPTTAACAATSAATSTSTRPATST